VPIFVGFSENLNFTKCKGGNHIVCITRTQVLFEEGPYMRKYGMLKNSTVICSPDKISIKEVETLKRKKISKVQ
jgi:hypothetical protein